MYHAGDVIDGKYHMEPVCSDSGGAGQPLLSTKSAHSHHRRRERETHVAFTCPRSASSDITATQCPQGHLRCVDASHIADAPRASPASQLAFFSSSQTATSELYLMCVAFCKRT